MSDITNLLIQGPLLVQGPSRFCGVGRHQIKTEFEVSYFGTVSVRYPYGDEIYSDEVFDRIAVEDKREGSVAGYLDFLIGGSEIQVINMCVKYGYDNHESIVSAAYAKLYSMILSGKITKKLVVLTDSVPQSRHYTVDTGSLFTLNHEFFPVAQPSDNSDTVYN